MAKRKLSGLTENQIKLALDAADRKCAEWHGSGTKYGICQQGINAVESALLFAGRGSLAGKDKRRR